MKKNEQVPVVEQTPQPNPPAQPATSFNPLSDPVNEKNYSGPSVTGNSGPDVVIPEHVFQAPPEEIASTPMADHKSEQKEKKEQPAANPGLQDASQAEKSEGAATMADVILNTWGQLYKAGNELFKFKEKDLNKLQHQGVVDLSVEVPIEMGWAPMHEVFKRFNNDAENLLVLEKEFVEEVHPLLTEELAKAGHGMTNRQKLMFLVASKLTSDGIKTFQFLSLKRDYLRFAKEQTAQFKGAPRKEDRVSAYQQATAEPKQNAEEEQMPEVNNEEQAPVVEQVETMQEKALKQHYPSGVNNTPNFGNGEKLKTLDKAHKKERQKAILKKSTSPASYVKSAKKSLLVDNDPAPTSKNKRRPGRPPGAKNKNK